MRLRDLFFVTGTIEDAPTPVTKRMLRLRINCPTQSWTPGQQIRISVDGLLTRRTYSIWDGDETGLELRVLDHGDGPGARWARTARPGQEVVFTKPEGSFVPRPDAPYHLFVGEETASVPFGPMLRSLNGSPHHAVIEVDTPDDRLPLENVHWHYREGAPAASSDTLLNAVRDLSLPDEPGVAYVAGEAKTIQSVRAHLVNDRGWPRRTILTKPFWTPGKKGME
ncbi:siderophore-interacting protein [Spirillospora sp. NPDC029432]|uniref:siderophore-interacting protein n=1 Tax=Spirillospora sp. NPDC029432 TaxID=3154599 RepID=UPI003456C35D